MRNIKGTLADMTTVLITLAALVMVVIRVREYLQAGAGT